MSVKVIRPCESHDELSRLKIFLAGPIQGAPDWQALAIEKLTELLEKDGDDYLIASPRSIESERNFGFEDQVLWETQNLQLADVILFYLCNEEKHYCDRAYAQTTRFELGEHFSDACKFSSRKLVIGFDNRFTGTNYIKERVKIAKTKNSRDNIKLCDGLEEAVQATVELVQSR